MDKERRKELLEQYKQIKTYMGIIQVKNNVNGRIFIDTCSNLKNRWFTLKGQLDMGRHPNSQLQKDWNESRHVKGTFRLSYPCMTNETSP